MTNQDQMVALVREASGEQDVEALDVLPTEIHYDGTALHPRRMVRIANRFLAEVVEHPGEWWMGELGEEPLQVWGSYGSLEEAAASH